MPKYRHDSAHEWLDDRITSLSRPTKVADLAAIARDLMSKLDGDQIQDLFQSDMSADGFFEPIEGECSLDVDPYYFVPETEDGWYEAQKQELRDELKKAGFEIKGEAPEKDQIFGYSSVPADKLTEIDGVEDVHWLKARSQRLL